LGPRFPLGPHPPDEVSFHSAPPHPMISKFPHCPAHLPPPPRRTGSAPDHLLLPLLSIYFYLGCHPGNIFCVDSFPFGCGLPICTLFPGSPTLTTRHPGFPFKLNELASLLVTCLGIECVSSFTPLSLTFFFFPPLGQSRSSSRSTPFSWRFYFLEAGYQMCFFRSPLLICAWIFDAAKIGCPPFRSPQPDERSLCGVVFETWRALRGIVACPTLLGNLEHQKKRPVLGPLRLYNGLF